MRIGLCISLCSSDHIIFSDFNRFQRSQRVVVEEPKIFFKILVSCGLSALKAFLLI